MKRLVRSLAIVIAFTILSAYTVLAYTNHTDNFYFTANGEKITTSTAGLKANDGDYNAYITTLASNGVVSNVFPRGGTFYARTRLSTNMNGVYSPLFTFRSNEQQAHTYGNGMAKFGQYYKVKAEIADTIIDNAPVRQCVRWCP